LKKKIESQRNKNLVVVKKRKERLPNKHEEIATQIRDVDDFFIKTFKFAVLRPDARLLLCIVVRRSVSIKEAMLDSALSYRAFYTMIDRLKEDLLINVEGDVEDGRVRRLVLGRKFNRAMGRLPIFLHEQVERARKNHPVK
jgi:hypothetical protein